MVDWLSARVAGFFYQGGSPQLLLLKTVGLPAHAWLPELLLSSTPTPAFAQQGLPTARLRASNGADAVVAWNASALTAHIVWLGSEEKVRGQTGAAIVGSCALLFFTTAFLCSALPCDMLACGSAAARGMASAYSQLRLRALCFLTSTAITPCHARHPQIDWFQDALLFFSGTPGNLCFQLGQ